MGLKPAEEACAISSEQTVGAIAKGFRPILQKKLSTKESKLAYEEGGTRQTRSVPVSRDDRERFVLSDDDILTLAPWAS